MSRRPEHDQWVFCRAYTTMHPLSKETEHYIDDAIAGLTKRLGVLTHVKKMVATALAMEVNEPIEPKLRQVFQFIERYREVIQGVQTSGRNIDYDFILRTIQEHVQF